MSSCADRNCTKRNYLGARRASQNGKLTFKILDHLPVRCATAPRRKVRQDQSAGVLADSTRSKTAWSPSAIGGSFYLRLVDLVPEVLDEVSQVPVGWFNPGQSLGIVERGANIPGVAIERDERHQGIMIRWVPRQALLENRRCIGSAPRGMQPDRIHKGISCALRFKLGGAVQFAKRIVRPL